ncbi:F-box protein At5g07610-like isoform X2 [Apium graveolens]|uniref:F-box protein At5g07610-like isoform X2 n=1 Tax=Apium graveolens TaxID=4045 RepID=UPI003D7BBBE5
MEMDILSDLLQDLLINILCRLPEKDVYKCKSLSRRLYDFITFTCVPHMLSQTTIACPVGFFFSRFILPNPQLKNQYLPKVGPFSRPEKVDEFFYKLAYSSFKLIFTASGWDIDYDIKLGFIGRKVPSLLPFKHYSRDLLDVCNGLLLFIKPRTCRLYVCNPTTKQCISIPKLCDHRPCKARFSMLAFDPWVSSHYKIVRLPLFEEDVLCLDFDIFSSETGVWVRRTVQLNGSNSLFGCSLVKNSAYLDGVLYRLLSFNSQKLVSINLNDIDSVTVQVIELPVVNKLAVPGCIGVSRGNLYYAHREPNEFYIWHLNEEAASWVLNYVFNTNQFETYIVRKFLVYRDRTSWLSPYAVHPTDDIIFIGTGGLMFALYLKTGTLYLAYCAGPLMCVPGLFHPIFMYVSCAVPLNNFIPTTTHNVQVTLF